MASPSLIMTRRGFLAASLLGLAGCQFPNNGSSTNSNTLTVHNLSMHPDNWQKWQKIAALGMLVNVNYNYIADNEQQLIANLSQVGNALQTGTDMANYLQTPWQVVWGPAALNTQNAKTGKWVSTNTLFLAKGQDPITGKTLYVLSVAATNQVSETDWVLEDINVINTSHWLPIDAVTTPVGIISAGTRLGLNNLLSLRDPNTGRGVLDYLRGLNTTESAEIAVCGASLGGALSSVLALTLIETFNQEKLTHFSVSAYPMAGPTPGDATFASYAASRFGDAYFGMINRYDIVPASWTQSTLAAIPTLYQQTPFTGLVQVMPATVKTAVESLALATKHLSYARIAPNQELVFDGVPLVNAAQVYPVPAPPSPVSFFQEAAWQHIPSYLYIGLKLPQAVIDTITRITTPPLLTFEVN